MSINQVTEKMSKYRWTIVAMLFMATTVNYLDRQVLSLTWKDFIAPEFHWTDSDYGTITALFSAFYAVSLLFAGRLVDWLDTKKGYLWAIAIWSIGAVLHAFCGIATSGVLTGHWFVGFEQARHYIAQVEDVARVLNVSVVLFVFARLVLAIGEAGNFPAAIKTTAEYFPKKDRAYATSIFNAGATVGALAAPVTIPVLAKHFGWEAAFIVIGGLGFLWMGWWQIGYKKPHLHARVNKAELEYIDQDDENGGSGNGEAGKKISFAQLFKYKQTWAFAFGKFMTDGVWWFYLFWTPAYLSSVYGMESSDPAAQLALFILYAITLLSIIGGWLPTYFVDSKGMHPYAGRMKAMLIFAFFPLLAVVAQPLGHVTYWFPVIIIGIAGAAHQAWSANIFTTVSDMFPKAAVATVTGIGGLAGGLGSVVINKGSGVLFDYARESNMNFLGYKGIEAGYFIIFCVCAVAYLIGWVVMKTLVPKYKAITDLV
ncbi:MFS transporter [Mangrovibacterium lignilyticum]|uniref:MFS transporter n=1 Tax=Mangrovibacterium lignilyticum TaxID=2668052 RepID=UPI0013D0A644|nr:MFS transporter [Mangrovibacterium lignilyticum]